MATDIQLEAEALQLPTKRRRFVHDVYLHRLQRRHFLIFSVLPLLITIAAIVLAFYRPLTWVDLGLFAGMWFLNGLGMSLGFHRVFSHKCAKLKPSLKVGLCALGSMAAVGPLLSWVALHRLHHESADMDGDVHSPNLHGSSFWQRTRGFFHAHYTWMARHQYPNITRYAPDLLKDRTLYRASQWYVTWIVLGLVIPGVLGGLITMTWWGAFTGFLWGGVVRMFAVANVFWSLSSFSHLSWFGTRPYRAHNDFDNAGNNPIFALLSFGEGWHNNHHAFPWSAHHGLFWWSMDYGFWVLKFFEAIGLAYDVRVPSRKTIASRRVGVVPVQVGEGTIN